MVEYVTVAQASQIPSGGMILVDLEDDTIVIANVNGEFYAFGAECTHAGGPLGEGELEGKTLICPWHGGEFDIQSGQVLGPPPQEEIPTYEVKVEGADIKIAR
ncbi:MAG: non-heme iron oxygenase ferredoxin subunit [Dehalococcoidia bacterium]